jgi:hypothetical protein
VCPCLGVSITVKRQSPGSTGAARVDCLEGEDMSRKLQFVAVLLILSSLSLGTLNALPLPQPRVAPQEEGRLLAVVDWLASFLPASKPHGKVPNHSRPKSSYAVDPNGSPH